MTVRIVFGAIALCATAGFAAADPSLECSIDAGSQVDTGQCLAEVEEAASAALDIVFGFARDAATELDKITERAVALPALEAAQTAWAAYRDAGCNRRVRPARAAAAPVRCRPTSSVMLLF